MADPTTHDELRETVRVLEPGGRFAVPDVIADRSARASGHALTGR